MSETSDILRRAKELSPWHFDFEISPGVTTASLNDPDDPNLDLRHVETIDPTDIEPLLREYYPSGFAGKDFLDIGCNAGGYCFLAHQMGARRAIGVDVRRHWIDQAEWIKSIKYQTAGEAVQFVNADIREFLRDGASSSDIILFKGVLYHLADPIGALLEICDKTKELLLIDTASSDLIPEHCITLIVESTTHVMSGIDGLAWLPGGPRALRPALELKGFKSIRTVFWLHGLNVASWGRIRIAASRLPYICGFVDNFRAPGTIMGWARQDGYEESLIVRVLRDEREVGRVKAVEARQQGDCGFRIDLSQPVAPEELLCGAVKVCCLDSDGLTRELPLWENLREKLKGQA